MGKSNRFISLAAAAVLCVPCSGLLNINSAGAVNVSRKYPINPDIIERGFQLVDLINNATDIADDVSNKNTSQLLVKGGIVATSVVTPIIASKLSGAGTKAIIPVLSEAGAGAVPVALAAVVLVIGRAAYNFAKNVPSPYTLTLQELTTSVETERKLITVTAAQDIYYDYESHKEGVFGMKLPFTTDTADVNYIVNVKAGLDMEKLQYKIDNDNGIIYIRMPEPEIFSTEIDDAYSTWTFGKDSVFTTQDVDEISEIRSRVKRDAVDKLDDDFWDSVRMNNEMSINTILTGLEVTSFYTLEFVYE